METFPIWAGWLFLSALAVSTALTWGAIAYGRYRGMLDHPGRRRSHQVPTPRGGGIGLVVAALVGLPVALLAQASGYTVALVAVLDAAALGIAAIGWLDDHHPLGPLPRVLVQLLAAVAFVAVALHGWSGFWWALVPCVLVAVWSINLHNFMDGIDTLLGLQIVFLGLGIGLLAGFYGQIPLALGAFVMAAAGAGFLLFNWPPARIFMGDVGSGCAGFLVFALGLLLCTRVWLALWPLLLLSSAFMLDAGLTLAWRMWCGKRWYRPHREHLYQWLVRVGWSHVRTGYAYMLWNLLLTAPLALWAALQPAAGPWLCLTLYIVGSAVWWQAKGACLRGVHRKGERHRA